MMHWPVQVVVDEPFLHTTAKAKVALGLSYGVAPTIAK
jgi:hypothetical protein